MFHFQIFEIVIKEIFRNNMNVGNDKRAFISERVQTKFFGNLNFLHKSF